MRHGRKAIAGSLALVLSIALTTCSAPTTATHRPTPTATSTPTAGNLVALAALASTATQVSLVTWSGPKATTIDTVLRGDVNSLGQATSAQVLAFEIDAQAKRWNLAARSHLIIYSSFNRGGSCISAIYRLDPATNEASVTDNFDGLHSGTLRLRLPTGTVTLPRQISLSALRSTLRTALPATYPIDAMEWDCPGP